MDDQFWHDLQARRPAADGRLVYAVKTTGIYCRPGCPSRRPRRENVALHADWAAAEAAGFRPCKRCDPCGTRPAAAIIAETCRRLDRADAIPSLNQMAAQAGYSPFHFHRLFVAQTGLTPRQYVAARRAERMRGALAAGGEVTQAIYAAGYNAPSRFYAEAPAILGMAPAAARRGGRGERIAYAFAATTLGTLLAAATPVGICAIELGEAAALLASLRRRFPAADLFEDPALDGLLASTIALVENGATASDLPLDLRGTTFQMRVWQALREIPAGTTLSYAALASRIAATGAARAVAAACAANPLAIAVPCHRVLRGDSSLAGYRWGLWRKRALLEREIAPYGPGSRISASDR